MSGTKTPAEASAPDGVDEIATLRIELRDTDPLIWRELEIPTSITLRELHQIVQIAMGWLNAHLWEFAIRGQRYGSPVDAGWGAAPQRSAAKVRLRELLTPRRTTIDYTYDFGDSWEHRLIITRVRPGALGVGYPRYLAGEWNGPPEDCGGIPGFYRVLEVLADADHPDHDEVTDWLGEYDPKVIDEVRLKFALARIANRRAAGRKRSGKVG